MLGKGLLLKTTALLAFFRSSLSTEDLLTVVCVTTARIFNRSGATQAVALDISKTFDRV